MPKFDAPYTTAPKTVLPPGPLKAPAAATDLLPLPRPPQQHKHIIHRALKGVYPMIKRLRSSWLRSEAVRTSRLDAAMTGDRSYLLLHYFHSIK